MPTSGGGGGWASKLGGVAKLNPIGMVGGALGGVFGALGANKKAKIAAENENKNRKWENALNRANYGQTDQVRNAKRNRSAGIRESLFKGLVRTKSHGLDKILGGFGGTTGSKINYNEANVPQATNVYDEAGPVPTMKAETGGWQSVVGGGLKGLFG
jgi:hypothetical protein